MDRYPCAPHTLPTANRALDLAELENRVMLSATPAAVLVGTAATEDMLDPSESLAQIDQPIALSGDSDPRHEDFRVTSKGRPTNASYQERAEVVLQRELVFVDVGTEDNQQLMDDLLANANPTRAFEIHVLDAERDGVQQISAILTGYSKVDAVHLVSHGTQGKVKLGNVWLDIDGLDRYARDVATWNNALRDGADLLIYGCGLASNVDGRMLSAALSELSGADVAASTDDTGHIQLGGDWDLEFAIGAIETEVAFSAALQANWLAVLPNNPPTTTGIPDVVVIESAADTVIDLTAHFSDVEDASSALTYFVTGNTNPAMVSAFVDNGADTLTLGYLTGQTGVSDITILAMDTGGLTVDTTFTVTVNPASGNQAPTDITLDNTTLAENAAGAIVGNLGVVDPDVGDTHTWGVDDVRFEVVAGQLKLKAGQSLNFESEPSVNLTDHRDRCRDAFVQRTVRDHRHQRQRSAHRHHTR